MSHMRYFLEPLLWTDVQWFRPTPLMFHTFVDIWKFSSVSIFTRHMIAVFQRHHMRRCGLSLRPRNQYGWRGTRLVSWPVAASVALDGGVYRRQAGLVQMVESLKAVCLMVKGSGEVAGCVCASMHVTHKIRRLVVESGEHYGWFMERQEDKLVEFRRMLYMVAESGPQNIRRVVVEGSEHSCWFMEEQEDKLVEFWRML